MVKMVDEAVKRMSKLDARAVSSFPPLSKFDILLSKSKKDSIEASKRTSTKTHHSRKSSRIGMH